MVYMSGCICLHTFLAACLSISIVNVSCHISTLRPSESFLWCGLGYLIPFYILFGFSSITISTLHPELLKYALRVGPARCPCAPSSVLKGA